MSDSGKPTGGAGGRRRTRGTLHAVPVPPANRKPRISEAKIAELDRLLADQTLGRNEIARRAQVSVDTVTRRAEAVGRSFDVSKLRAANDVKAQDGRSKRRELAERLLADALEEAQLRAQLDRREARDAQARANLSRSLGTLVKAVADLDAIEIRYRELESSRKAASQFDEWLAEMIGTGTE